MTVNTEEFDAIVVGGGPGGSSAATFVAMRRHRVLLLERERLPVYKIGESLLPSTIHGVCAMLGVGEDIKRAGFVKKWGGTFRWGRNREPWTFAFSQSARFQSPTAYAYQVERLKFDSILLNNARSKGVDVREGCKVTDLIIEDGRLVGVKFFDTQGESRSARAPYIVDASGHTSPLARFAGEKIYSTFFRNVAIFGYYLNGKRLPEPCSGNIFSAAFDRGWFWYIPLSHTLTSVGAVIGQEYVHILQQGPEAALTALVKSCSQVQELLEGASRAKDDPYAEVRVRKDYSYTHTRFWQRGLVLIGDAACFVDPIFSSGVHLATYSALLAARAINTCLRGDLTEDLVFSEFERRYRREYKLFYDFLVAFYDVDQDLETYYWCARKVVDGCENGNEAFIQLVGGVAGSGEHLYNSASEFVETPERFSKCLFPAADVGSGMYVGETASSAQRESFMAALTAEGTQMQIRGTCPIVGTEAPLFDGGLIPSKDGLHWKLPASNF